MPVKKAGRKSARFADRCTKESRDICDCFGDFNVFVDEKGPYCLIIDREFLKLELDGDRGINSSTIEACWLVSDCIPIHHNSKIRSGNFEYKVKGSPMNQHDGWICAELSLTCEHC